MGYFLQFFLPCKNQNKLQFSEVSWFLLILQHVGLTIFLRKLGPIFWLDRAKDCKIERRFKTPELESFYTILYFVKNLWFWPATFPATIILPGLPKNIFICWALHRLDPDLRVNIIEQETLELT